MRSLLAWVWILCGIAMMVLGLGRAVSELASTYGHVLDDPLGEPDVPEEQRGDRMLVHVAIGAGGLIPLGIGGVLLARGRARGRARSVAP